MMMMMMMMMMKMRMVMVISPSMTCGAMTTLKVKPKFNRNPKQNRLEDPEANQGPVTEDPESHLEVLQVPVLTPPGPGAEAGGPEIVGDPDLDVVLGPGLELEPARQRSAPGPAQAPAGPGQDPEDLMEGGRGPGTGDTRYVPVLRCKNSFYCFKYLNY